MICGSHVIREALEADIPFEDINAKIDSDVRFYRERINDFLLY
jgi:hypothetical protein